MGAPPVDPCICGFWAFTGLLPITMLAMLFRNTPDISDQKGEFKAVHARLDETSRRIGEVNTSLTGRMESLERRTESFERRIGNFEQAAASRREYVARETG